MKILFKYLVLILCLFISSLYFNIFQLPNKIVTGGSQGVSIIINYYLGIEPSNIILIISIILLLLGFITLGIYKTSGAIVASIIYPFFIKITSTISLPFNIINIFIICIIIGILSGVTTGIVYKIGFSNGGFSIVSEILSKYTNIPLSKSNFIINMGIVLLGCFSLGLKNIFFSFIILLIHSFIIKLILHEQKNSLK